MLEEERGKEFKKVVGELRCNSKEIVVFKRLIRGRKVFIFFNLIRFFLCMFILDIY